MLNIKNQTRLILCCCAFVLLTVGCWGARETDELGYILVLGIDKGKENDLHISFQIAGHKTGEENKSEGEKSLEPFVVEAASIYGALQLADTFVSKDLTLMHTKAIIISADLAREGLIKYINTLIRDREIRRNTFFLITPGRAEEVLKNNNPRLESNVSRQMELLLKKEDYTGLLAATTVHEINTAVISPGKEGVVALIDVNEGENKEEKSLDLEEKIRQEATYLPGEIPHKGGNKVDAIGLAVLRGDKLVGYLNGAEARYYHMLKGSFKNAVFTFPEPQKPDKFTLEMKIMKGRSPIIKVSYLDGIPRVEVTLVLEGEIVAIGSGTVYETGEKRRELEKYLAEYISLEAYKVIRKTQKDYQSDIFGFGDHTRKFFLTWPEWESYGWLTRYPEVEISVKTSLDIRRTGLMGSTAPAVGR